MCGETLGKHRGEEIMTSVLTRNGRLRVWVVPTLVVLIVACAAAAMLIGRFSVSLEDVVAALRALRDAGKYPDNIW